MYDFNYAIERPDGKQFTGTAYGDWDTNWSRHPQEIFTFGEEGAYRKIKSNPNFSDCIVVRV